MNQHDADEQLTTYVLGGLDAAGAAEVEERLARDPAARARVAELRALSDALRGEFRAEPQEELAPEQRRAIVAAGHGHRPSVPLWSGWLLSAAALLVVGLACTSWFVHDPAGESDSTIAQLETNADGWAVEAAVLPSTTDHRDLYGEPPSERAEAPSSRELYDDEAVEEELEELSAFAAPEAVQFGVEYADEAGTFEVDSVDVPDFEVQVAQGAFVTGGELDSFQAYAGDDVSGTLPIEADPANVDGAVDFRGLGGGGRGQPASESARGAVRLDDDGRSRNRGGGSGGGGGEDELRGAADTVPENTGEDDPVGNAAATEGADGEADGGDSDSGEIQTDGKKLGKYGRSRSTWRRARATPNASQLKVGDEEYLALRGMQARVKVDGFRARVLLDCFYLNDRAQSFEGTFQLRLPDGASPYFFAFGESVVELPQGRWVGDVFYSEEEAEALGFEPLDIMADRRRTWREPKEARMVPREKAAHAYGETVRRRVDPALMEWSGAGVFQARVFPLAAGALHRIVIGYDVDLVAVDDVLEYRLELPLVDAAMQVDVEVARLPDAEIEIAPGSDGGVVNSGVVNSGVVNSGAVDRGASDGHRVHFHWTDTEERAFTVRTKLARGVTLLGEDPELGPFFAMRARAPEDAEGGEAAGAQRAVFALDTSLSSTPDLFHVWYRLLPEILARNEDSLREFAVLVFDVQSRWWRSEFVANDAEQRGELVAFLESIALEGATDLATALRRAAAPEWSLVAGEREPVDLFLLSDAAATWGERDLLALSGSVQAGAVRSLYAYRTGLAGTDGRALDHLTRACGGAVFTVPGEEHIAEVARAHRRTPWNLRSVQLDGCSDLCVAGRPATVYPGQELIVSGRGRPGPDAELVLGLVRGGVPREERILCGDSLVSELAARVYGEEAVRQLELWGTATEATSKAYATHFRVPGRTCSLLMLESEEDYQRFQIQPEEDAFVVGRRLVESEVHAAETEKLEALTSPKARLRSFLERLETMPGMSFSLPSALELVLDELETAAFVVEAEPLECARLDFEGTPGRLQDLLAARQVDYRELVAEAQRRRDTRGVADALRALSSLVEISPGDVVAARDVAFSALEYGRGGTAYHLLLRVAELRPFEPQTYWNLALCLEQLERADLAMIWFEVALAGEWDGRFGEFRRIVGVDYLRFLRRIVRGDLASSLGDYASARLRTLGEQMSLPECDLLVTVQWNTDRTDVDLHVVEPTGEECYYSHRDTAIGGHLTRDVTQGYGPEMYTLQNVKKGRYRIFVHYFASDQNRASVRSKVYASLYRDWGTDRERVERRVLTLETGKDRHDIAVFDVK